MPVVASARKRAWADRHEPASRSSQKGSSRPARGRFGRALAMDLKMDVCERRCPMTTRTNDRIGVRFQHALVTLRGACPNARINETVPRQSGQHRLGLSPASWPNAKRGIFLPQLSRLPHPLRKSTALRLLAALADADDADDNREDRAERDDRLRIHGDAPFRGCPERQSTYCVL